MSYTILTSRRRWTMWNNLLRINVYLGLWVLGRYDPKLGADLPRSWGGSTAFGADRPGADQLWGVSPVSLVLHNSSHTGSGIIVYGLSLKFRILWLIEVVHRWFSKRKHILRQLTCWCAIFSGNIPASCVRAYRSARRLRNGRGYKPCLSIIYTVIDKQRLRIRLISH